MLDWFASLESWVWAGLLVSCTWMAVIHFSTAADPLFDRKLFADRNFLIAFTFLLLVGATMFATIALLPPMLQRLYGYDVIDTGLVLMPRGIGVIVSMRVSGWLMRKGVDARWQVGAGFLIVGWSLHLMSGWSLEADAYHFITTALLQGMGIGLVFLSLNASAFATLAPHLRTDGSSLLNLARSIGSAVGISVVTTLAARNLQINHAELAEYVTPELSSAIDLSSLDRFQQYGQAGLAMVDAEVSRQAMMIAYIDDFWLMGWVCFLAVPMVLLMRSAKRAG